MQPKPGFCTCPICGHVHRIGEPHKEQPKALSPKVESKFEKKPEGKAEGKPDNEVSNLISKAFGGKTEK